MIVEMDEDERFLLERGENLPAQVENLCLGIAQPQARWGHFELRHGWISVASGDRRNHGAGG